jgi:hypothetical protein
MKNLVDSANVGSLFIQGGYPVRREILGDPQESYANLRHIEIDDVPAKFGI